MAYDIPVAFHFAVDLGFGEPETRFQEVTGLALEVATEELREGGLNTYAYALPTGAKHGNLALKRGFTTSSELTEWCRKAVEEFTFEPRTVTVSLLDQEHQALAAWTCTRAYPVKWAVSDFKAQENGLVIESLELAYLALRRI